MTCLKRKGDQLANPLIALSRFENNHRVVSHYGIIELAVRLATTGCRFLWVWNCEIDFTLESSFDQVIRWYQCPEEPGDPYPRVTDLRESEFRLAEHDDSNILFQLQKTAW